MSWESILSFEQLLQLFKTSEFCKRIHGNQTRKYNLEPYYLHPQRVANILIAGGVNNIETLQAALLHDSLEDTKVSKEEIKSIFGAKVLKIVEDVTNQDNGEPKLNTREGLLIKLADMIDNVKDSPNEIYIKKKRDNIVRWMHEKKIN